MMRLANYFLVVGYDHDQSKSGVSGVGEGKVVQKFPTTDWRDCPFDQSIQEFCQPGGWLLASKPRSPNFMLCALTNSSGGRLYCACLTFDEPARDEDENVGVYAPKSLVLLSSHNYCNLLKNCLSLIYTIFTDELPFELENVISNILAEIPIPSPGGPRVTFSLGAGDTHAVQPPQCGRIPITSQAVSLLFQLLGIQNVLMLFSAMLTDQKILITSRSFVRLFDICHALSSLLYPLRYVCVYIPVLPKKLLDYLSTPTPCLVGIHVSFLELVNETYEFCIADIDKGSVEPPRNLAPSEILMISEPFYSTMLANLTQILNPDLLTADLVFTPTSSIGGTEHAALLQDKRLRAVFLHFFLQLFVGYRSCLSITRVHPHPVIHFNQSLFMLLRGLPDTDEFLTRFFLGMTFPLFIQERGSPFREVDLFDRMIAEEALCRNTSFESVERLANELMENERDLYPPEDQSLPTPKSPAGPARVFPQLDEAKMERKLRRKAERFPQCDEEEWAVKSSNVPMGPVLDLDHCLHVSTHDQHTKLNVLRACLDAIFDNRISDAKKVLRAVKRDLKSRVLRHQLVRRLERLMSQSPSITVGSPSMHSLSVIEADSSQPFWPDLTRRGPLQRPQFDLVVELLDEALRQDAAGAGSGGGQVGTLGHFWLMGELGELESANGVRFGFGGGGEGGGGGARGRGDGGGGGAPSESDHCGDCSGIAASVLHIATQLHMQVHNVKFFAYMCEEIQKHPVWQSQKFWKSFLHLEVAKQIHQLYLTQSPSKSLEDAEGAAIGIEEAMKAAAEELRRWPDLEESARATWVAQEERSVVFQIQHCLTAMLHFRLPVHISERRYQQHLEGVGAENASSVMTNSDDGIDSVDRESGIDDQAQASLLSALDHFMRRFVRIVAAENDLPQQMVESLEEKIEALREGDIATLEEVRREVKRPRPTRTEVAPPELLPREELLLEAPLRAFLLPDGRWDPTEQLQEALIEAGPSGRGVVPQAVVPEGYLPAEGAVFLTNYRLIFLGIPVDCLLTDRQICRSFPVASLMAAKKLGTQRVPALASLAKDDAFEVMLLRAASFQLLRLAFEEDVPRDAPDIFRDLLLSARYPLRLEPSFLSQATILEQEQEKTGNHTSKSKSTLTRVRKFCMRKVENTRLKVTKRTLGGSSSAFYRPSDSSSQRLRSSSASASSGVITMPRPFIGNESKYLEWLQLRPAYRDLQRQGLGHFPGTFSVRQNRTEGFKLSMGNAKYQLCRSYPAMLVVPTETAERSLTRLGRGHREGRFPVITFRHGATRALLLRAGGFRQYQGGANWRAGGGQGGAGMATINEREASDAAECAGGGGGSTSEFLAEQERYLSALVAHSPDPDTISLQGGQEPLFALETPLPSRREGRDSGRAKNAPQGDRRWSQFYATPGPSGQLAGYGRGLRGRSGYEGELSSATDLEASSQLSAGSGFVQRLTLGPLVVLGEKSQMKVFSKARGARQSGVSFLPVAPQFSRKSLKESFKKLHRICVGPESAPQVSGASSHGPASFQANLQQNDWLRQVKGALQLAGVVADIMDAHGSSVMVALEEGWDITTQVICLAQLMLDPHYRTLEGFAQLIDKEWLSFGYRFTHRASQVAEVRPSGYSPVFLLFLDCVHQLLRQFPTRFEFNDFYLQFLAYHHLSGRFSSFKFDCEAERMAATYVDPESSIWSFIDTIHKRSPIFFNFAHTPSSPNSEAPSAGEGVLRPATNMAALAIWNYYVCEEMAQRTVFDVDLLLTGTAPKTEGAGAEESPVTLLHRSYNYGLTTSMHSAFFELLRDAGSEWMELWHSVQGTTSVGEEMDEDEMEEEEIVEMERARYVAARAHRRATREILRKGRQFGEEAETKEEAGLLFKQAHQFSNVTFSTKKCDLCSHLCFGEKAMVCSQCKYYCHEKCVVNAPKNCSRLSAMSSASASTAAHDPHHTPSREPPPRPPPPTDLPASSQPPAPPPRPPPVPAHATPPDASSPSTPSPPAPPVTVTARPAIGRREERHHERLPLGRASPVARQRRSSLGSLGNGTSDFGSRGLSVEEKLQTIGPLFKSQQQQQQTSGHRQVARHDHQHSDRQQSQHRHPPLHPQLSQGGGRAASGRSGQSRNSVASRDTPIGAAGEFSGYLHKQGQYLRQWKRRFFILDSVRHQLQYYESEDLNTYRGFIPLDNVKSVKQIERSGATPLKKMPDFIHIIEVETDRSHRPHRFAAENQAQATAWCEQLQASIS